MNYDTSKGIGFAYWEKMLENADKIAQIDGLTGEKDTYGSLLRRCIRAAITMRSKGIVAEDVVITCSLNYLDICVPMIASQFLGAIQSALDPTLSLQDIVHLLKQVTPKLVFVMPDAIGLIEEALEEVGVKIEVVVFGPTTKHTQFSDFLQANQLLEETFRPIEITDESKTGLILFSSGTTGMPKGICIKNLAFIRNISAVIKSGYYTDLNLITTSLYWITANLFLTVTVMMGTARLLLPKFNAEQVWNAIKKYEPKMMFAPPLQLMELANHKLQLDEKPSSLKYIVTGGVAVFQKHFDVLNAAFPNATVFPIYGQTEAGMISTFRAGNPEQLKLFKRNPLSVGQIVPEYTYQIVDLETEKVLGPNTQGELLIKADCLYFNGYFNADSSEVCSNGWYRTGDIVYCNEDGCLYIVDRAKEMLKFQSWHVPPAAIEQVLVTHPAVETCMVIGIPDEMDGDHPMAVVVLKKSHQDTPAKDIQQFVESQVDDRKKLRGGVRIIKQFPTFITGKMKRKVIRDMVLSGEL